MRACSSIYEQMVVPAAAAAADLRAGLQCTPSARESVDPTRGALFGFSLEIMNISCV